MIINRQNYQVWVTDYYDGQLDDFQEGVLMNFLQENPDLMSEFEDYPELSLAPGERIISDKSGLLRTPDQLTNEQLEHFAIALAENDLGEEQKQEMLELEKSDPRFRENINIYGKIKLKHDETRYPDKESLLKIPGKRRITRIIINSLSVAASAAILTGLFMIFWQAPDINMNDQLRVEAEEESSDLPVLAEDQPLLIPEKKHVVLAEPVILTEIEMPEPDTLITPDRLNIQPLASRKEVRLDIPRAHYLLAETQAYPLIQAVDQYDTTRMSVREFLAYHFRKQILNDEEPGVENIKAWEIADAGIKGVNTLLGWNMDLNAKKGEEGKLENISFTSQLIKFDHNADKNKNGL